MPFPVISASLLLLAGLHANALANALQVSFESFAKGQFDFVIIGGGTAGLALATRLSDDPKIKVGVIEAGGVRLDDKILIPGMFGAPLGDPDYDWNFATVPQSLLEGRQLPVFRGKMLGGTSGLNGMVQSRASVAEYDGIGSLGNPGWNFDVFQQNMKKSENWTAPNALIEQEFFANNDPINHGTRGAIKAGAYSTYADVVTPYFEAAKNLKIPINKAMSSGNPNGVWTLNAAIDTKNVSRCFSYNGYYLPNSHRSNLVVVTGAQVTKILTNTKKGVVSATGVEYVSGNKTFTVNVMKEVILSAGAIQTPQVLELSGIGNKTLLEGLSIPVVLDLPGVGENYLDHFGPTLSFQSSNSFITSDKAKLNSTFAAQQFEAYVQNRTGIYSATSATTLGFLPLHEFLAPATVASLLSDLDAALPHQPSHLKSQFALQRKWLNDPSVPQVEVVLFAEISGADPEPGKSYYSIALDLQHLWSRGSVHITTADPLTPPNIDGQYLNSAGDFDMKLLIESVKWAQKLSQTEPLKNVTLASISLPLNATDDEIRDFIVSTGNTEWHFAGTAAMLPRDQNGVVDSKLKVYGTSNIRVVDASILPVHIATHPTMTLYGIAERVAEALRTGEWQ